jgi:O-antigen/teichoic acid export membrane protein
LIPTTLSAEIEPPVVQEPSARLVRGGAIALIARGGGVILSMATAIITARFLGPEGKGTLAFLSASSSLAVRAGSLGVDGSFAHFHLARRRPLAECLGAVVWICLGAALLATIASEASLFIWPSLQRPAFFVLFVSTFVFFGLGRELSFGAFDIGYRASLMLAFGVVLVVFHGGITAAVWVQIVVSLSFGLIAAVAAGRALNWSIVYRGDLVLDMLRYGVRYYAYGLLRYALCYGGVLIAGVVLSSRDAGLFSVSLMLGEGLILFASSINLAFYPAVATSGDPHQYTALTGKRIVGLSLVLAVVLAVAARPLIQLVYGQAFLPSVAPFLYMLPALVLLSGEQVMSSYFAARGMPWSIVVILACGVVLGVVLAVLLAAPLGIAGVAVATAAAQSFVAIAVLTQFARVQGRKPDAGMLRDNQWT